MLSLPLVDQTIETEINGWRQKYPTLHYIPATPAAYIDRPLSTSETIGALTFGSQKVTIFISKSGSLIKAELHGNLLNLTKTWGPKKLCSLDDVNAFTTKLVQDLALIQ